ncbi:hypothetical protein BSK60_23795 [Paenibacillus odorifer]|nr:hypothetical protein BSK60_23795 [Paenibacillus odorifer]
MVHAVVWSIWCAPEEQHRSKEYQWEAFRLRFPAAAFLTLAAAGKRIRALEQNRISSGLISMCHAASVPAATPIKAKVAF